MKIAVKKVYCPSCHSLVKVRDEASNHKTLIICTKCGRQLYEWNGIRFKPIAEEAGIK